MATALYCSMNDVKNRLSAVGVSLRIDDSPPASADGDVLDDASAEIDMYCLLHYSSESLAASRWIKHKCADIATFLLCERRGNPVPAGIAGKFERAIAELQRIHEGNLKIADMPKRRVAVPAMSNMRPTNRPYPRTVVERNRSTHVPQDYRQNRDPWDGLNASGALDWQI